MEQEEAAASANNTNQKSAQSFACVVCAQRKVKCDRELPCSNCVKGRVECEYRAPPPARRRKRKQPDEQATLAKLDRYEKLLNNLGYNIDDPSSQASEPNGESGVSKSNDETSSPNPRLPSRLNIPGEQTSKSDRAGGRHGRAYRAPGPGATETIFIQGSKMRYVENNLWGSLGEEILRPKDMLPSIWDLQQKPKTQAGTPQSDDRGVGGLLFGSTSGQTDLRSLHPSAAHMEALWRIYRTNVDPVTKLFDINMKERMFLKNIPKQLDGTSQHASSLFFAVYFCAITSIEDEECLEQFGESRTVLLDRYQGATEQALVESRLLQTSDVFVLQAFFMYLLCIRLRTDAGTLWILTGVAIRMAQRGGLHRDADFLGDTTWPWSAELRRRLWWQIVMLDGRNAELSGAGKSLWSPPRWDTKIPRNINDDDLSTESTELPPSRVGATDMILCSISYELCSFFRDLDEPLSSVSQSTSDKLDAAIDDLERRLEQKYLSYCDPLIPLHFLSVITARSAVASMRFRANHPRRFGAKGAAASQAQRDKLFALGLKALEYDNLAHSTKSLRKFKFHYQNYFPWHQLIYVLSELRTRTTGSDADRAWDQIEGVFEHRAEYMTGNSTALHAAVLNLALRVWDARKREFERQLPGVPLPKTPPFVQAIQAAKAAAESKVSAQQADAPRTTAYDPVRAGETGRFESHNSDADSTTATSQSAQYSSSLPTSHSLFNSSDPSPSNWPEWDELIFQDFNFAPGFVDPADLFGPVP